MRRQHQGLHSHTEREGKGGRQKKAWATLYNRVGVGGTPARGRFFWPGTNNTNGNKGDGPPDNLPSPRTTYNRYLCSSFFSDVFHVGSDLSIARRKLIDPPLIVPHIQILHSGPWNPVQALLVSLCTWRTLNRTLVVGVARPLPSFQVQCVRNRGIRRKQELRFVFP